MSLSSSREFTKTANAETNILSAPQNLIVSNSCSPTALLPKMIFRLSHTPQSKKVCALNKDHIGIVILTLQTLQYYHGTFV
jgi:hypothetical protein